MRRVYTSEKEGGIVAAREEGLGGRWKLLSPEVLVGFVDWNVLYGRVCGLRGRGILGIGYWKGTLIGVGAGCRGKGGGRRVCFSCSLMLFVIVDRRGEFEERVICRCGDGEWRIGL